MTSKKMSPKSIGDMAADREGVHNVVLELLAEAKPESMTSRDLWAQTKGALRWSLGTLEDLLKRWVENGLTIKDGSHWKIGKEFRAGESAASQELAAKIAARQGHVAIAEKLMTRQESITRILNSHTPVTGADMWRELHGLSHDSQRTLQRDLVDLEKTGVAIRTDDGWLAGPTLRNVQFEARASAAAMRLLARHFSSAIPQDIQSSLRTTFTNAKKKLDALGATDPRVRWLEAIRLIPGRHPLDGSKASPNVMDAIEDAVLTRSKLQLTWIARGYGGSTNEGATGSVSHFLLELPDRPSIEFWPEGAGSSKRILIEDVLTAVGTRQLASWPSEYEPVPFPAVARFIQGDAKTNDNKSLVVLRVSDEALSQLDRKKISVGWHVDREAQDGWTIVSFRALVDLPLFDYLKQIKGVVILRPFLLWKFAQVEHRFKARQYEEAINLVREYKLQEDREYEANEGALGGEALD